MRECPKCGCLDSPCWRHKRFRLYTDYCHIEELEEWEPEIAEQVKANKDIKIGHYIYHLTKARYVWRLHEKDSADGKTFYEPSFEGKRLFRNRFIPLAQKKLVE